MKKLFDKLPNLGCMLPFILGGLFPIVMMFIGLWKFSGGNIGLFILNLILVPLAIIGGINVLRGVAAVFEMDGDKFNIPKKGWRFYLFILIHFGGYFALVYMIVKYI